MGGGITGASVAYHLAKAGWRDTVLVEKDELTSGSTCHAAGLVTQFNPSPTMMRFRRYSVQLYEGLVRLHIAPALGPLPLSQVSPARVRAWRAELIAAGVSSTTTAKGAATVCISTGGNSWFPIRAVPRSASHA